MSDPFDHRGLLEVGCHEVADLQAFAELFAFNDHRVRLLRNLRQFIGNELEMVGAGLELVVGGSYVTNKAFPGDLDCVITVPLEDLASRGSLLALAIDGGGKGRIWQDYKVEFYAAVAGLGLKDIRQYFEYVGEKCALQRNLQPHDLRGTIKVKKWTIG